MYNKIYTDIATDIAGQSHDEEHDIFYIKKDKFQFYESITMHF